jgi:mannosyltransferase
VTAVAASLRFATLDVQSFGFDETVTVVDVLQPSLVATLESLPDQEHNPPLYFILAWLWATLFGEGEEALRSLSALLGTATIPVVYAAAKQLISQRAGLVSAGLCAVHPLLVWYSQEARPYALLILLGSLSLLAFARALDDPSPPRLAWWGLASSLALTTHYHAVFLVAAETLWLLVASPRRRHVVAASGAIFIVGASLLPLLRHQRNTGVGNWVSELPLDERLAAIPEKYIIGWPAIDSHAWPIPALLGAIGVCFLLTRTEGRERRGALIVAALGAGALTMPLALALIGRDYLYYRHVVIALLLLLIVAAGGFAARGAPRLGISAALAVGLAWLGMSIAVPLAPRLQREDWRTSIEALERPLRERAIVLSLVPAFEPLVAYGTGMTGMPSEGARVNEILLLNPDLPAGLRPERALHRFQLVERRKIQRIGFARLRAAEPQPVTARGLASALSVGEHRVSPSAIASQRPR